MQDKQVKILIIRFSSIGDIVLTTPVIRCLKKQLDCELHYVTKQSYRSILGSNPYIDKVWSFENHLNEILNELAIESFDYIIDLHKNIRSAIVKKKLKAKSFSFHKANLEKWLMVNLKINRLPQLHIVDRYLKTVAPLGIKNDGQGLDFFISAKQEAEAKHFLQKQGIQQSFVAIVIGAQHITKIPNADFFIKICQELETQIILIGGPNEKEKGIDIAFKSGKKVINSAGQLSIGGSAAILQQSKYVISPDTGMMHIAAALDKNIISIWGSTIPEFGMTPYYISNSNSKSIILEKKGLSCRPCSKIGFDKCPKKHFNCMVTLNTSELLSVKF